MNYNFNSFDETAKKLEKLEKVFQKMNRSKTKENLGKRQPLSLIISIAVITAFFAVVVGSCYILFYKIFDSSVFTRELVQEVVKVAKNVIYAVKDCFYIAIAVSIAWLFKGKIDDLKQQIKTE